MTQQEKREYIIKYLLSESPRYENITVPADERGQKELLRALFNVRMPTPASDEFLRIQDEYLRREIASKGITELNDLSPIEDGIYLWQGDITTLACDAIVNAANSALLGCFVPGHHCIDNAIHTFAGIRLRLACNELMQKQGHEEKTGQAKLTPAYALPCKYVLHTVGPIIRGEPTEKDAELLASCYRSCLELAEQNGAKSIAFCCISTGEFHYPTKDAAKVAIKTVRDYRKEKNSRIEVIFNVFKDIDYEIYRGELG